MREGHVEGVVGLVSDSWMDSEVDSRVDSEIDGEEALEERLLRVGSKIFCSPLWRRLVGFCICSSPHFRYSILKVFPYRQLFVHIQFFLSLEVARRKFACGYYQGFLNRYGFLSRKSNYGIGQFLVSSTGFMRYPLLVYVRTTFLLKAK